MSRVLQLTLLIYFDHQSPDFLYLFSWKGMKGSEVP